jgi:23S rRNA (guanosine2251-2'-O)-methyltransferase
MKKYPAPSQQRSAPRSAASSPLPQGHYWLFGIHPVQMALENSKRHKSLLLVTTPALEKLRVPLQHQPKIKRVTGDEITAFLPAGSTHQGVALAVQPLAQPSLEEVAHTAKPLVMLDQVTDPQNIGAIIRSAAAFGAGAVIVQAKHSPSENATIAKTAAGALEVIPYLAETNLSRAIETLQKLGYWAVGLEGEATQSLAACSLSPKTLVVMGAEGAGLRRLVAEHCDSLAKLPIHPQMESLNVSVAAGIALYEITRNQAGGK